MTMNPSTRQRRTTLGLLASAACLALAACATAPTVKWPTALEPAANESFAMVLAARGVQIYECRSKESATAWEFVAPEAELFDDARKLVGTHGAGPFWQSTDGSRVVGTLKARADAPVADAIPWLVLTTRSTGPAGRFSAVTSVRRVHTVGGNAPQGGCSAPTVGAKARVLYSADYFLYTTR
jgi:hypothetical protein